MAFYTYYQNNTFGSFDEDEDKGIGYCVIIEANSARQANERALELGLYFDGVENGQDCDCCGDRWSEANERDAMAAPTIYGEDVSNGETSQGWANIPNYVHYFNEQVKLTIKLKEKKGRICK